MLMEMVIDERIINAVRQVVNRIESQHLVLFSVVLSVSAGIAVGDLIYGFMKGVQLILFGRLLAIFFVTFLISYIVAALMYMLFRGEYSAALTLVFGISSVISDIDWKKLFKDALAPASTPGLREKYETWGVRECMCDVKVENGTEYLLCEHRFKGPIHRVKLCAFKVGDRSIILTMTFLADPFRVFAKEFLGGIIVVGLESLRLKLKRRIGMEVDLWFDVLENLTLFLDEVKKRVEVRANLKNVIV